MCITATRVSPKLFSCVKICEIFRRGEKHSSASSSRIVDASVVIVVSEVHSSRCLPRITHDSVRRRGGGRGRGERSTFDGNRRRRQIRNQIRRHSHDDSHFLRRVGRLIPRRRCTLLHRATDRLSETSNDRARRFVPIERFDLTME